jgi:protein-disulfide isomerase
MKFAAVVLTLALSLSGCGQPRADAEFGAKVRAYLLENPEVLQEAYEQLQVKEQRQALAAAGKAIEQNRKALEQDPRDFVANPGGKVTVVEFFDYNCGYCRLALPTVIQLVKGDGKIRLVLKELPIFGDDSVAAAKLALASNKQGKYFEMH